MKDELISLRDKFFKAGRLTREEIDTLNYAVGCAVEVERLRAAIQTQHEHEIQREQALQEINAKLERYSTSYTEMSKRCEELSDLRRASDAGRERLRKRVQLLISALRQAKIDSNAAIMRLQGVVKRLQEKLGKCFQQAMEVPEPEPVNDTQFATMTGAGFFLTHYYNNYAHWRKDNCKIAFKRSDAVTQQWLIDRLTKRMALDSFSKGDHA